MMRRIDAFVHPDVIAGPWDDLRRARVLVACCWGAAAWAGACFGVTYYLEGLSPTAIAFLVGGLLVLGNPLMLSRTASIRYPSLIYCLEIFIVLSFLALENGGFSVAVLLWQIPLTQLAGLLVGVNFGVCCAALVALETTILYYLTRAGFVFPHPLAEEWSVWLTMLSLVALVVIAATLTWVYEHARQQAVTTQEETAARYEYLIRNSSDLITLCNAEGIIVYVSPSVEALLGFQWDDMVGQNVFDLTHPEDREVAAASLGKLIDSPAQVQVAEYRVRHRDGSWRMVQTTARNAVIEKAVAGIVANSRDITETYELNRSLVEAKERAEAANLAKSEFLANMSHELRTPLHGILSFAGFGIKRSGSVEPEKLREYFTKIEHSGRVLLVLLNDILDLAKLEAGKMTFNFQPSDLNVLVATLIDEFSSLTTERHLVIDYPAPDCETLLVVDPIRIMQVLRNLLSNAVKFSPARSRITIGVERDEAILTVAVSDQGVGVPEGELDSIFDKFVQSSKTTSGAGGTGLGLSICREIIHAHQGRIWARNRLEGGTQFSFELPVQHDAERRLEAAARVPASSIGRERRKFERSEQALRTALVRDAGQA